VCFAAQQILCVVFAFLAVWSVPLVEKSSKSKRLFVAVGGLRHVIIPVISTLFPLRDAHFP